MKEFLEVFKETSEAYKFIEEFQIYIGNQKIGIRIREMNDGGYLHTCSHHYQGPEQAGPYNSSICIANTKKEAYGNAHRELYSFYNEAHEGDNWVKNDLY